MWNDLFNGLFGYSKDQTQLEQQYIDALSSSAMGEVQQYQHMLEQARAQQAVMNQKWSGGFTKAMQYSQIKQTEYDELTSLSNWCQSVHPEVYEEWRAMQDLKKASEDESA